MLKKKLVEYVSTNRDWSTNHLIRTEMWYYLTNVVRDKSAKYNEPDCYSSAD